MIFFWGFLWWLFAAVVLTWVLAETEDINILDAIFIGVVSIGGPPLAVIALLANLSRKVNWDIVLIKQRRKEK